MKRSSLFALSGVVFAAACQDAVTSPRLSGDQAYSITGNPPPPPIDTGARGRFLPVQNLRADPAGRFLQPRFSILQSASPRTGRTMFGLPHATTQTVVIDPFDFFLPVKYNLSKDGTDGELQFLSLKNTKAVLKACKVTMVDGVFSGKGTLTVQTTNDGLLVVDCSSIEQSESYFERCGIGDRCFHVVFGDATLDGEEGSFEAITSCDPQEAQEDVSCPDFNED